MKKNLVSLESIFILIFLFVSSITFAVEDRISLGYIYNSSKSQSEIIDDTNGNVNTVSPTCFDLTSNGNLDINSIFSQDFVNEMHEKGVLVTPFLSNHWGRKKAQAALKNADALADQIAQAVEKYNLDGVNVDLENLLAKDKDNLTNFIRILREKLSENKILTIAVGANPYKLTNSWVSAYDYSALAEYVDYMVLMAYDEHSAGGSEGPVASINFVEESVKVILESASRDKIVLGMPLYGRFWEVGADNGGEAIIQSQIEKIAKRYNTVPVYSEITGTSTFTINVQEDDNKAYINGRYLPEGTYTIYYDGETSFNRKLEVMNEYGLRGAALWALGNEEDKFWDYYGKGLNDEEYESEESIRFKAYLEAERIQQEERLRQQKFIEENEVPLEVNFEMDFPYKYIKIMKEIELEDLPEKQYTHLIEKNEFKFSKLEKLPEKIYDKEKLTKKIEKIKFNHIFKRLANEK